MQHNKYTIKMYDPLDFHIVNTLSYLDYIAHSWQSAKPLGICVHTCTISEEAKIIRYGELMHDYDGN
jgi:hypothetical protein